MAEDEQDEASKTEEASERKLERAREEGNVPLSQEVKSVGIGADDDGKDGGAFREIYRTSGGIARRPFGVAGFNAGDVLGII